MLYVIIGLVACIALLSSNTSRILLVVLGIVAVPFLALFGIIHGSALIVAAVAVAIVALFVFALVKLPRGVNISHTTYVNGDNNYVSSNTTYTNWRKEIEKRE
jgi:Ca2+/Na+ antiporter